ncbi:hypothetical protein D3C86_1946210 [compost metagenome]
MGFGGAAGGFTFRLASGVTRHTGRLDGGGHVGRAGGGNGGECVRVLGLQGVSNGGRRRPFCDSQRHVVCSYVGLGGV